MTSNNFISIDVFCTLDVGKAEPHGRALLREGRTGFDKPLPGGDPDLRQLFARLLRQGSAVGRGRPLAVPKRHLLRAHPRRRRRRPTP
ncbi:hypothetical protein [Streptomyces sp. NPDC046925]|uniref:hypothetical protein n=1 Tax=Streptomyces sp. NPDC046925 TaxID=3155375 RepID=UPI0033C6F655